MSFTFQNYCSWTCRMFYALNTPPNKQEDWLTKYSVEMDTVNLSYLSLGTAYIACATLTIAIAFIPTLRKVVRVRATKPEQNKTLAQKAQNQWQILEHSWAAYIEIQTPSCSEVLVTCSSYMDVIRDYLSLSQPFLQYACFQTCIKTGSFTKSLLFWNSTGLNHSKPPPSPPPPANLLVKTNNNNKLERPSFQHSLFLLCYFKVRFE